ncbi:hypothetical protein SAY86_001431 [Trapa natans]|uniref:Plant bHLH transcription factor ACT-like domain-containing protein n=1 Tax=Trapa natans TaxID=22666 RepID=A0AAN7N393_TRANT|nr:hypothetical protein SAY86_001431 [Trapa natans]
MELRQNVFLEELLMGPRREMGVISSSSSSSNSWAMASLSQGAAGGAVNYELLPLQHQWWNNFDPFEEDPPGSSSLTAAPSDQYPLVGLMASDDYYSHYPPLVDPPYTTSVPELEGSTPTPPPPCPFVGPTPSLVEDHQKALTLSSSANNNGCKVEVMDQLVEHNSSFSIGCCGDNQDLCKLAGRKMDRTSILGDTIDYMKELLERINKLQDGEGEMGTSPLTLMGFSREMKPNEVLVRNSPKFDVERRDIDTRVDICCATKPGLLLSTVNTLEALGLEIQQCVISCFSDFSMRATCSEVTDESTLIGSEEIKQALFRNAGYGGRILNTGPSAFWVIEKKMVSEKSYGTRTSLGDQSANPYFQLGSSKSLSCFLAKVMKCTCNE